ncbi:MAG: L-serine ammonia-lyase [Simkaniaceae bacterium]|nr:L-serine ammonia-lyase [Simkaniaceae bacterium]
MSTSLFDLFSIGIGPSSSHTVGPMRAAKSFLLKLKNLGKLHQTQTLVVELFGSLAMTGHGHGTDRALLLGFEGHSPENVPISRIMGIVDAIENAKKLQLLGEKEIAFNLTQHMIFEKGKRLPYHSNAMRFTAKSETGSTLHKEVYYSTGGGFILSHQEVKQVRKEGSTDFIVPFPYSTYAELSKHCKNTGKMIWEVVLENEMAFDMESSVRKGIWGIWSVMKESVERGLATEGILPGGLNVKRRAPELFRSLKRSRSQDPAQIFDWVSLYALAVNEENAAGHRVVTSPTNGAAGVIPAVLHYYEKFVSQYKREGVIRFFLTATAIGSLFKAGASLSAAEMGCQGEVGVAASMAAGGLTAALGGTNEQIENAAEIAMEHHLGLTCDPVGGLVQIPCIERNTMGALKAINASRLALKTQGEYKVRLDEVIAAMRETGEQMHHKFKETSIGGLAVSVGNVEC